MFSASSSFVWVVCPDDATALPNACRTQQEPKMSEMSMSTSALNMSLLDELDDLFRLGIRSA
jgi:hypothetical protein